MQLRNALSDSIFDRLMGLAAGDVHPEDARLFALALSFYATRAVGSMTALTGLSARALTVLFRRYFPGLLKAKPDGFCLKVFLHGLVGKNFLCRCDGVMASSPTDGDAEEETPQDTLIRRYGEISELRDLLLAHRTNGVEEEEWFASLLARASMGANHLWQDAGFLGRNDVSLLLSRHFTSLHDKNTGNMKWKKFFYKQLCEREGMNLCRAPSCSECSDMPRCFGPEEAEEWELGSAITGAVPL